MSLDGKGTDKQRSYHHLFMQSKRGGSSSLVDGFLSSWAWAAKERSGQFQGLGINGPFVTKDLRHKYDFMKWFSQGGFYSMTSNSHWRWPLCGLRASAEGFCFHCYGVKGASLNLWHSGHRDVPWVELTPQAWMWSVFPLKPLLFSNAQMKRSHASSMDVMWCQRLFIADCLSALFTLA